MISSSQIRAGRALVDISQSALAELAGVSLPTIKRMERLGPGRSAADNVEAVRRSLEAAGVVFIDANGGGAGVRLRNP